MHMIRIWWCMMKKDMHSELSKDSHHPSLPVTHSTPLSYKLVLYQPQTITNVLEYFNSRSWPLAGSMSGLYCLCYQYFASEWTCLPLCSLCSSSVLWIRCQGPADNGSQQPTVTAPRLQGGPQSPCCQRWGRVDRPGILRGMDKSPSL